MYSLKSLYLGCECWTMRLILLSFIKLFFLVDVHSQSLQKWEFSGNIQANHSRLRSQTTFINPQYQLFRHDPNKYFNTSLDFELIRVKSDVWQHGIRAGGIMLGGGDIADIDGAYLNVIPRIFNTFTLGLNYFQIGYQVRLNPIAAAEKYLLKTNIHQRRLNVYFMIGSGMLLDLGDKDRPLYRNEWFPYYFTASNGEPGMINKDYYIKSRINAYINAELQLALKITKHTSIRFGVNKLLPIGRALFETRNEFYLNNELITYSSTQGGGLNSAARIGVAYHFNQFSFKKNKLKK
jgi:hypothetical protein